MKYLLGISFSIVSMAICSCNTNPPEDKVTKVSKSGSVETSITVRHADSIHDVLITSHTVWLHDSIYKTFLSYDTVPALGLTTVQGEDANGNTQSATIKKDYEIFITVK